MTLSTLMVRPGLLCGAALFAALGACSAGEQRLVLVYPDDDAFERASWAELFVAEAQGCDDLDAAASALRLSFDPKHDPPSLGAVSTGKAAFRAQVRDRGCQVFLQGCVEVVLDYYEERTTRISLEELANGATCAAGLSCAQGRCYTGTAIDAGEPDVSLEDAAPLDGTPLDAMLSDIASSDSLNADASLPDTSLPDGAQPDSSLPDGAQPDSSLPDISLPDTSLPDTSLPDTSLPDTWTPPPVLEAHHSGSVSFSAGQRTRTIDLAPGVDEAASLLIFSATTDSISPSYGHVSGELINTGSQVRFERSSTGGGFIAEVAWTVLQLDGAAVQRGYDTGATTNTFHLPLSPAVDLQASWPLYSTRNPGSIFNEDDWFELYLSDTDTLGVESVDVASPTRLVWQVVDLASAVGAEVLSGRGSIPADTSLASLPIGATIDPAQSALFFTYKVFDASLVPPVASYTLAGHIEGDDSILLRRLDSGRAIDVSWSVLTWDEISAQHGVASMAPGEHDAAVALTRPVDPARSVVYSPAGQRGGTSDYLGNDEIGTAWATFTLSGDGDEVLLHRAVDLGNAEFDWTVIEFR